MWMFTPQKSVSPSVRRDLLWNTSWLGPRLTEYTFPHLRQLSFGHRAFGKHTLRHTRAHTHAELPDPPAFLYVRSARVSRRVQTYRGEHGGGGGMRKGEN